MMMYFAATVLAVLIVAGGISDLLRFRIPNGVVIALLVLFALVAILEKGRIDWLGHVAPALFALAIGYGFFVAGYMGAGDVKFLSALILWTGMGELVPFLLFMSFAGLGFMLLVLAARRTALWGWIAPGTEVPRVLVEGEGIPYGFAIAFGALMVLPGMPIWALG